MIESQLKWDWPSSMKPLVEIIMDSKNSQLDIDPPPGRYECDNCGRSYKHQFHLKAHLRECSKEPLFSCLVCRRRFYHSRNLGRHMQNIHKEPPKRRTAESHNNNDPK
nr:zinc finger protein 22-like [Halyomorpha halys]